MKKLKITEELRSWPQTWANYYSHLIRSTSATETHSILAEERATQKAIIQRAEEHLEGVTLFYEQSALADPHPPGKVKKGPNSHSGDPGDTISEDRSSDTPKSTRELSDREI